jgi:hypothetical protein
LLQSSQASYGQQVSEGRHNSGDAEQGQPCRGRTRRGLPAWCTTRHEGRPQSRTATDRGKAEALPLEAHRQWLPSSGEVGVDVRPPRNGAAWSRFPAVREGEDWRGVVRRRQRSVQHGGGLRHASTCVELQRVMVVVAWRHSGRSASSWFGSTQRRPARRVQRRGSGLHGIDQRRPWRKLLEDSRIPGVEGRGRSGAVTART